MEIIQFSYKNSRSIMIQYQGDIDCSTDLNRIVQTVPVSKNTEL